MAFSTSSRSIASGMRLLRPFQSTVTRTIARHAAPWASPATVRALSSTSPLQKKRKIAPAADSPPFSDASSKSSKPSKSSGAPSSSKGGPEADPENPLDFSFMNAAFAPIDSHFKAQLQALLHGGRFDPANLGALPVSVKDATTNTTSSFPLRELAQIVPRGGRTISLLLNDRSYVKPIMSAVQSSAEFNQQPQRSEDNELELLLKVELERKDDSVRRAKELGQSWRERVRQVRAKHDKTLKEWKKNGTVLADVMRKAEKELQKVQDKKMKEVEGEEAQTIKQLERNSS